MDLKIQLKQLGLAEREAKVMRFLLYSGGNSPSLIAKELGLNRVTVYDILNALAGKGLLVKKIIKKGKFSFQPTPPKHWLYRWQKQEDRLSEQKKAFFKILPDLEALYTKSSHQPRVIFYEGQEGIKKAALDSLEAISDEIVGYSAVFQVVKFLSPKFVSYYCDQKIKREIKSRFVLRGSDETAENIKKYQAGYYKKDISGKFVPRYRFYPVGKCQIKNEIMIYDDKVTIINLAPSHFGAVLIQNQDIAESQKAIFEIAWQASKSI